MHRRQQMSLGDGVEVIWNCFFYLKSERILEGGYSGLVRGKVYKFSMRSSNSGEGGNLKMFGHFKSDLTQDTTPTIPELVWCVETYAEGYRLGVHFAGKKYFWIYFTYRSANGTSRGRLTFAFTFPK